jgi:hypothetical protein
MAESYQAGDRVEVYLDGKFGDREGWHAGTIFKVDPYSQHRSFYWVELDDSGQSLPKSISVLNPKNIRKV